MCIFDVTGSFLYKFADDTKVGMVVETEDHRAQCLEWFKWDIPAAQMNNTACIVLKYNTNSQYCIGIGNIFKRQQYQYQSNTK